MKEISPFTEFTHFGSVHKDRENTIAFLEKIGLGPFRRFLLPSKPYFDVTQRKPGEFVFDCAYGHIGSGVGLEIFCPKSEMARNAGLDARGDLIWHYGYDVDDYKEALSWMEEKGYPLNVIADSSIYTDGTEEAKFNVGVGGAVIQLHWHPNMAENWLWTDFFTFKDFEPDQNALLKKLTHVSAVVKDIDKTIAVYEKIGLGTFNKFSLPDAPRLEMSDTDAKFICAYGSIAPGSSIGLELFEPVNDAAKAMFDDIKGEYVFRLSYDVDDLNEVISWIAEKGVNVVEEIDCIDGTRICRFDTSEFECFDIQCHEVAK